VDKSKIVKNEKDKAIVIGAITFIIYIYLHSNQIFQSYANPQSFIGILITLTGINIFISGITFTYKRSSDTFITAPKLRILSVLSDLSNSPKNFKIYKGFWVRITGLGIILLGCLLFLFKIDTSNFIKNKHSFDPNYIIQISSKIPNKPGETYTSFTPQNQTIIGSSIGAGFDIMIYETFFKFIGLDMKNATSVLCPDVEKNRLLYKGVQNKIEITTCDNVGNITKSWIIEYIPKEDKFLLPY